MNTPFPRPMVAGLSLRQKFALLFLAMLVSGLAAMGHISMDTVYRAAEENALLAMKYTVRRIVRDATMFHMEVQRDMRTAMESPVFQDYFALPESLAMVEAPRLIFAEATPRQIRLKEKLDLWLMVQQKWYPFTESCVIDRKGKEHARIVHGVMASVDEFDDDEDQTPFFAPAFQLAAGEIYAVPPYFTRDSDQWVFAYTSPIVLSDGSKPAFLHMEIAATFFHDLIRPRSGSYFDRLLSGHGVSETTGVDRFIILDDRGKLVADSQRDVPHPPPALPDHGNASFADVLPGSRTLTPDAAFQEIVTRMTRGEEGQGRFLSREGKAMLVRYHPLPFFGLSLAALRPYEAMLEGQSDLESIQRVMWISSVAILLLSTLAIWWIVGRVVRPLADLAHSAREIAAGRLDTPFPDISHRDEIGLLAHCLHQMRASILVYHQDLEDKVAQRTEKYLGANMKLQETIQELEGTREELVHREKMASLGRLVAGFAHEINTPVGIAIGSLSILPETLHAIRAMIHEEEVDGELLERRLDKLDESVRLGLSNLARAAEIVSRFKRTSVDQSVESERLFNVMEVIDDVVLSLHSRFKKSRIWIETHCPEELSIYSQPGALGQVLTNLLMNSLIHGFDNGQQAGTIEITAELNPETHIFAINYSDTGKGMNAEVIKKIFDPFFTTARDKGGSGLGMYICYNIVRTQLKGNIECGSHPGEGTVFLITFPVRVLTPGPDGESR